MIPDALGRVVNKPVEAIRNEPAASNLPRLVQYDLQGQSAQKGEIFAFIISSSVCLPMPGQAFVHILFAKI